MEPSHHPPRRVTIKDVALRAGVSLTAASYALSGRDGKGPSGSAKVRAKVSQAAQELGYIPNNYARAMRRGHSDAIILALGTVADPWGIALTQAVRAAAHPHGKSTVLLADETWYEFLTQYPADCAFVTSVDITTDGAEKITRLCNQGLSAVAFSEHLSPDVCDVVTSSPRIAVGDAYTRLRSRHERVHFISRGHTATSSPLSRVPWFRERALAAGDDMSARSISYAGYGVLEASHHAAQLLDDPKTPRAIITSTGYIAQALTAHAHRRGLRLGYDIEIISIGDVPASNTTDPAISYYGVRDVFTRIAHIVVHRALHSAAPFTRHTFAWEFFPGATTLDAGQPPIPSTPLLDGI